MEAAELRMLSMLLGAPDDSSLEVLEEMKKELRWLEEPIEELAQLPLDQWQGEHTRLFIAGYPRTPCSPFASVWIEKRMQGTPLESLLLFYVELGLESPTMPADYLGTMLECAALLEEDPGHGSLRERLWQDHLMPWLPEFATALAKESRLKIYRMLARRLDDLTNEFRMAVAVTSPAR